uniref:Uncharacterized protein n=1 Tax=Sipha flava TaxID=143950 RepID=A0A2S2Q7D0_9HEMI
MAVQCKYTFRVAHTTRNNIGIIRPRKWNKSLTASEQRVHISTYDSFASVRYALGRTQRTWCAMLLCIINDTPSRERSQMIFMSRKLISMETHGCDHNAPTAVPDPSVRRPGFEYRLKAL